MQDYYVDKVNQEELIRLFQYFFGNSQRTIEYKLLFRKKVEDGKEAELTVHFTKKYKIEKIEDEYLPKKNKN